MGHLQKALLDYVKKTPELVLNQLLEKKLRDEGIKLSKRGRQALAEHILARGEGTFTWGRGSPELKTLEFTEADSVELSRLTDGLIGGMEDLVSDLGRTFSKRYLADLLANWPEYDAWEVATNEGFRERLEERWGEGLGYLRMLVAVSREIGIEEHRRLRRSRAKKQLPYAQAALVRLHVRACQIASEILTLMESGFADGAMARWRTLYEIGVVTDLIADAGNELAERYLAHDVIDEKSALEEYVRSQVPLGYAPPSVRMVKALDARVASATARYGRDFNSPYGWAAKHLGITKPQKVRFIHIEEAAGRTGMKSIYKAASYPVHAGSRSLFFSHAQLDPFDGPTAGATNAGLLEPGQNLAYTLVQITGNMVFRRHKTLDMIVEMGVLVALRDKIPSALKRAEKQLRKDEAARRPAT